MIPDEEKHLDQLFHLVRAEGSKGIFSRDLYNSFNKLTGITSHDFDYLNKILVRDGLLEYKKPMYYVDPIGSRGFTSYLDKTQRQESIPSMTTDEICDVILQIAKDHGKVNPADAHRIYPGKFTQHEASDCLKIIEQHQPPLLENNFGRFYTLTASGRRFEGFAALSKKKEQESIKERKSKTETRWVARGAITLTIINITWGIGFGLFNYHKSQELNFEKKKI